jgi:hypothetical protein
MPGDSPYLNGRGGSRPGPRYGLCHRGAQADAELDSRNSDGDCPRASSPNPSRKNAGCNCLSTTPRSCAEDRCVVPAIAVDSPAVTPNRPAIAAGGRVLTDRRTLRDQPRLFGTVASDRT